jgi:hypothetical protein
MSETTVPTDSPKLGTSREVNGVSELYYRELGWTRVDLIEEALMNLSIQTRTQAVRHLNDLQDDDLAAELNYSLPSQLLTEILNLAIQRMWVGTKPLLIEE